MVGMVVVVVVMMMLLSLCYCPQPCSPESTTFDIMALMTGVGIPPKHAMNGTATVNGVELNNTLPS